MEEIKSLKEIIHGVENGTIHEDDVVCFIGDIVTKKKFSKTLFYVVRSDNYVITCTDPHLDNQEIVKIDKEIYIVGKIGIRGDSCCIKEVIEVDNNVAFQKLTRLYEKEHDNIVLLHLLMSMDDEKGAIKVLEEDKDIDINKEVLGRVAIFSAIDYGMYDLFEKIVSIPNCNRDIEDGFGESLLESLIYLYSAENITYKERCNFERCINAVLKLDNCNFNHQDLNDDTAINIACEHPHMLWIVMALLEKKDIDINVVNDFDYAALGNAIRNKNYGAIKLLSQRSDLVVRDIDREKAKEVGIDLAEYEFACAMAE